jgi:hypothetical protein
VGVGCEKGEPQGIPIDPHGDGFGDGGEGSLPFVGAAFGREVWVKANHSGWAFSLARRRRDFGRLLHG